MLSKDQPVAICHQLPDDAALQEPSLKAHRGMGVYLIRAKVNGKGVCCWCGAHPLPKRRISWCSDRCVEEYRLVVDWPYISAQVEKRDGWVCAHCRRDMELEVKRYYEFLGLAKDLRIYNPSEWGAALRAVGFNFPSCLAWIQIDHITPVIEGGSNALSNLRSLCAPCHRIETAALRRRLAESKRLERSRRAEAAQAKLDFMRSGA